MRFLYPAFLNCLAFICRPRELRRDRSICYKDADGLAGEQRPVEWSVKEDIILDAIVLAIGCGFFVLFAGYVALCERL